MLLLRLTIVFFGFAALIACEDSMAKFHPGHVVVDKPSHMQGIVYSCLKPSTRQLYYLKLQRSAREVAQGASKTYVDGSYDEEQLEFVRRR